MNSELRKLNRKIDKLQKQINQQNEFILDQSLIIHKLIEKIRPVQPFPIHREEDFKKDNWQPYKGPECRVANVQKVSNMYGEYYEQFPI